MKRHALCLFVLSCLGVASAMSADLDVRLSGVASANGHVLVALYDSEDGWDGRARSLAAQKIAATEGAIELRFADLVPGRYGVLVLHDENDNGKLDTNRLGIPREGYGFSNNPRLMRRAKFEEVAFGVPEEGVGIVVEMR